MNKMKTVVGILVAVVVVAVSAIVAQAQGFPSYNEQNKVISATVTNGQTIGLNAKEIRLTSAGGATGTTNAIVITAAYYVDDYILVTCTHASTNLILLTDATTTLNLCGANVVLDAGESILLKPSASNACNAVSIPKQD